MAPKDTHKEYIHPRNFSMDTTNDGGVWKKVTLFQIWQFVGILCIHGKDFRECESPIHRSLWTHYPEEEYHININHLESGSCSSCNPKSIRYYIYMVEIFPVTNHKLTIDTFC